MPDKPIHLLFFDGLTRCGLSPSNLKTTSWADKVTCKRCLKVLAVDAYVKAKFARKKPR